MLLHLHHQLLTVLLGHLVELALALAILLVGRGLSDDTFGAVAVHSLPATLHLHFIQIIQSLAVLWMAEICAQLVC